MNADLDKLKELSIRLIAERKSLIETLAATPTAEHLSSESLRRLADVSAVGAAVTREITAREPHFGWGAQ